MFDYLIVGAGWAGVVLAERLANHANKKVLIIDKRPHIGGNTYDYYNGAGILVHKYGPHIFHTSSHYVFKYLSRFTKWRSYEHRVLTNIDNQLLPFPINLDTINQYYKLNLTTAQLADFFDKIAEHKEHIQNSEDVVVSKIGRELYEKFFRGYTRKQWGIDPSALDKSVTTRVPVRINRDDRYFTDIYQVMPLHGYTAMFNKMLSHPNIKLILNTSYQDILIDKNLYQQIIYTGQIDEFFNYCYGKLPYRSLEFHHKTLDIPQYQSVAVVNYPSENIYYTRVTEFKHLTGQKHHQTSIVYEYPCAEGDPSYPIPCPENAAIYSRYQALARAIKGVYFVGRLATYKYYNMDQIVAQSLQTYRKLIAKKNAVIITPFKLSV